ncbi:hypothetical protein U1Q18_027993 [Sarracenia purpurea var. burkii]
MQADQTVLSLRPGGGGGYRGSRVLGPSFDSSSLSSDLPVLRSHGGALSSFPFKTGDSRFEGHERVQYTRDQLLQFREVGNVPEAILKIRREVEAEIFGEDKNWGHVESNTPIQPPSRYSEPDNRDWRGRSAQFPTSGEERSWETIRENKEFGGQLDSRPQETLQYNRQDQLNSQFARTQISSSQGFSPALIADSVSNVSSAGVRGVGDPRRVGSGDGPDGCGGVAGLHLLLVLLLVEFGPICYFRSS